MGSGKLVLGGTAAAAVGVRVARSLYGRWRVLPEADRRPLETLAEDLKARALELRGALDPERARTELRGASESFAAALVVLGVVALAARFFSCMAPEHSRRFPWFGWVPEWLKGTDCKSVGLAYVGSNPTPSTSPR